MSNEPGDSYPSAESDANVLCEADLELSIAPRQVGASVSPAHWEAKARARHRLVSRPSESRDSDMGQVDSSGPMQDLPFGDAPFHSEWNRIKRVREE